MAGTLSTLSVISFVAAAFFFVLAIFFWIFFNIPSVIGDLTGRTARKSIEKMRQTNEKAGKKSYKESKVNVERGKVTGAIQVQPETGLLDDNKAEKSESEETGILGEETGLLGTEETALLNEENETASLVANEVKDIVRSGGKKIKLIEEILIIHTKEEININIQ